MTTLTQTSDRTFTLAADLPGWGRFRSGWSPTIRVQVADDADAAFAGVAALEAARWLVEHAPAVAEATAAAIFREYPTIVAAESGMFDDDERAEVLPDVQSADELAGYIQLSEFTLFGRDDGGVAFGVLLVPPWDEEHQLGVRGVGLDIVGVGDGDYACYGPA